MSMKEGSGSSNSIEVPDETASATGEHTTILLAEDNLANVLTIEEYLSDHGYKVVVAHNGVEAIAMAEKLPPNIILMDIQMPIMNGMEAIGRLRANSRFATTPIIALTALSMPGDRERCLEAGANEYLSKPVSLKGLIKTIGELLAQKAKSPFLRLSLRIVPSPSRLSTHHHPRSSSRVGKPFQGSPSTLIFRLRLGILLKHLMRNPVKNLSVLDWDCWLATRIAGDSFSPKSNEIRYIHLFPYILELNNVNSI